MHTSELTHIYTHTPHTHPQRERERERERESDEEQFVYLLEKVAKTVAKPNIYTISQFESPKHLQSNGFET